MSEEIKSDEEYQTIIGENYDYLKKHIQRDRSFIHKLFLHDTEMILQCLQRKGSKRRCRREYATAIMHLEAMSHIFEETGSKTQNHRQRYIDEMEILKQELTHYEAADKARDSHYMDFYTWAMEERLAIEKEIQHAMQQRGIVETQQKPEPTSSTDQFLDTMKNYMDQYLETMDQVSDKLSESIQEQVKWLQSYRKGDDHQEDDEELF